MLLFSSIHAKIQLDFIPLKDCTEFLPLITKWLEAEWGALYKVTSDDLLEILKCQQLYTYVGLYASYPVAIFTLNSHEKPYAATLSNVFIEKNWRGFGFAKQIINKAKEIALSIHIDTILLNTSKPRLNHLYEKYGARLVGERVIRNVPSELLVIDLSKSSTSNVPSIQYNNTNVESSEFSVKRRRLN